jgi:hypothetical protein
MSTDRYTTWAKHERTGKRWIPIVRGQTGPNATADIIKRQDTVRRNGQPVVFRLLPDGETPD